MPDNWTDQTMLNTDERSSTEDARERAANVAATAKEDARQVADVTKQGVGDVAQEAMVQAKAVGGMAKDHARGLVDQSTSQLRVHGDEQAQRAASGLDEIARQLGSLLDGRPQDAGQVRDYAEQLGDKAQQLAEQLRSRGVDGVVTDVTSFARRRPGLFLVGAAAAGFMAGRLVKAQRATSSDEAATTTLTGSSTGTWNGTAYLPAADIPPLPLEGGAAYADRPAAGPLGAAPGGGTW